MLRISKNIFAGIRDYQYLSNLNFVIVVSRSLAEIVASPGARLKKVI